MSVSTEVRSMAHFNTVKQVCKCFEGEGFIDLLKRFKLHFLAYISGFASYVNFSLH